MLLNNFYTILHRSGPTVESSSSGIPIERYHFSMELNPDHPVYKGHFPTNPVVPGVCQLQIISELVSSIKGSAVRLMHSDNVKFLTMMVPEKNCIIDADIRLKIAENGEISVNAILQKGEVVFIKFKGLFRKE